MILMPEREPRAGVSIVILGVYDTSPPLPQDVEYVTYLQVETPMDRCLVFENSLQHKVKEMHNKSSKVVVRKILCFFLVDPNVR